MRSPAGPEAGRGEARGAWQSAGKRDEAASRGRGKLGEAWRGAGGVAKDGAEREGRARILATPESVLCFLRCKWHFLRSEAAPTF